MFRRALHRVDIIFAHSIRNVGGEREREEDSQRKLARRLRVNFGNDAGTPWKRIHLRSSSSLSPYLFSSRTSEVGRRFRLATELRRSAASNESVAKV